MTKPNERHVSVLFEEAIDFLRVRPDGTYVKVEAPERQKPLRSQEFFTQQARVAAKKAEKDKFGEFVPIRPPSSS